MEKAKGKVSNVFWQSEGTLNLKVEIEKPVDFGIGQFVKLTYKGVTRPYSVCNFGKGKEVEMFIRLKPGGEMSGLLKDVQAGEEVEIAGPFKEADFSADKIMALAGGSGQAAFMSLLRAVEAGEIDKDVVLFQCSRRKEDVGFFEEIKMYKRAKVVVTLSREKQEGCEEGHICPEMVGRHADPKGYSLFICGPKGFAEAMKEKFKKYNPHVMAW